MKKYKVRFNCSSFCDVVVLAKDKDDALFEAMLIAQCPQNEMEFCEFLKIEKFDKIQN